MDAYTDVPIGPEAPKWTTLRPMRTVLVVVHNVTTVTRLLDILPVFDSDPRIQVVFSWSGADPFRHGVTELLDRLGVITIPWEQAKRTSFDLGIAASHHAGIADLDIPLIVLSHGIGYTKKSPGARNPEPGARSPEPGDHETFGLSAQWVLHDGRPFAAALGLSHTEQLDRLRTAAPAALPTAAIVGDPCYDRLLASAPYRARYRADLGTGQRRLVIVSSTWGPRSLLGTWPGLVRRMVAESTLDSHQFAVALHPNTWHGHGPAQIRAWLADCVRAGVVLLPEIDGWRTALLAADVLVGDHGSVTGYGMALGIPTVLANFPTDEVAPGSPIAKLGETAPLLTSRRPLLRQLDEAISSHTPEHAARVADLVTSAAGEALPLLRELCYRTLGLPEPDGDVPSAPLTSPSPPEHVTAPAFRAEYVLDVPTRTVRLVRRPAELRPENSTDERDELVCCPWDHPMRTVRTRAAVLTCPSAVDDGESWAASALAASPTCASAAVPTATGCQLFTRDSQRIRADAPDLPADALAAACHAWLTGARPLPELPHSITVELGGRSHRANLS